MNGMEYQYTYDDIDKTLQCAGGVGGLLWMQNHDTETACFYLYDANGNVTSLVDAATGEQVAEYDYSPFGVMVKDVSSVDNSFKFSTKYQDEETKYRELGKLEVTWYVKDQCGKEDYITKTYKINSASVKY